MKPIYFFMHLAKTGGTTFVGNLYKHLTFDIDFIDLGPHGNKFRLEQNRKQLNERSQNELDDIKIIVGHLVYWDVAKLFPNREHRFIIFLREPISRVISHYTFDTSSFPKAQLRFTEWYKTWLHNQSYEFLRQHLQVETMADVLERLKTFWHIGLKENLDPSLKRIYRELQIPSNYVNRRVAGEPENSTRDLGYDPDRRIRPTYIPTKSELNMIEETHTKDIWLYEHVKRSLQNFKYVSEDVIIPQGFS